MTRLKDIQNNTNEFNINFHIGQAIAHSMLIVFLHEENRKKVEFIAEELKKSSNDSAKFMAVAIIQHMFSDIVKQFLAEETGE